MSTLKVEVVKLDEVRTHPNADALDIAVIKGWQVVTRKGEFKAGDLVIYFPLDSILPVKLSESIGVTKYLSKGHIRAAKLRGEPSYGLIWNKSQGESYIGAGSFNEGDDLTEAFGVIKWEPPPNYNIQDAETPHILFDAYTDIQNMRSYPDIILPGEEVVMTEKLHGANSRHAFIDGQFMAGSHNIRMKENANSKWWHVFSDNMKELVKTLASENSNMPVIMYGEIFGWVQDLHYGFPQGHIGYRCFDIKVNGKYLNESEFEVACDRFKVETVPILFRGKFNKSEIMGYSSSKSVINKADNMMEGVVVKPVIERFDQKIHRVILKYVFDQYINRKGGTEYK